MDLRKGQLFDGRYQLVSNLGRGASAQVWLARDTMANNLKVAIKVLSSYRGMDTMGIQNFVREFTFVYNLQHQNLLTPTNYAICENVPYLVLPYCENGSSVSMIGRADEKDVIKFLHDVSAALECLHAHDIVHQDIKPDNVLLDDDCNFLVTDFGISTQSVGDASITSGSYGGTRAYMGPERFGKDVTPVKMNDIWALGATAYELITGNAPFGDNGGLVQAQGEEIPDLPDSLQPEVRQLILSCLEAEPWNRPSAESIRKMTQLYLETGSWKEKDGKRYLYYSAAAIAAILLITGLLFFDYHRTKIYYYKDYVERWGVPEGVGRLSGREARHMHRMYRFEESQGKVRKVSHVNSLGKIIADDESERSERPLCQQIFYTSEGKVSRIRVMDNNEKTLYIKAFNENLSTMAFQFDDEHNTERTLSAQTVGYGRILESGVTEQRGRISRWWIEYDKNGFPTKIQYAGLDNSSVGDVNNIYGRTMTYDDKGRVTEIHYFGKDGAPKSTKWGLGIKKFVYDNDDNWIRGEYLTVDGQPSYDDSDGVSIFEMEYDDIGNVITGYHKDGDGQLMLPKKNGVAGVKYEYDDNGFITQCMYLGVDRTPIFVTSTGYAGYRTACDENGFFIEQEYIDPSGNPCNSKNGSSKVKYINDDKGNRLEEWNYDVNGNLCLDQNGVAGYKCRYDSIGNVIEVVYYDTNRKPTLNTNGIAGFQYAYDDRNLITKNVNLGTDLTPAYNTNHVCIALYDYDKRGNMTKIAFYSPKGDELEESNENVAGWLLSYDDLGNETERAFFDKSAAPCVIAYGYASKKQKYDDNGNQLWERFYNQNGELTIVNGVVGYDYQYDARGNVVQSKPVGTNGKQAPGKLTTKSKYDDKDNCTEQSVYNVDRPAVDQDGVHKYVYSYNAQNRRVETKCYGINGKLTIDKSLGVAIEKDEFDNRGNRVKANYYGTDEKPAKGKEGWASSTYEYNAMGKVVKQCFFDVNGAPTKPSVMVPVGVCEYDKWGNMIYIAAMDEKGHFIINPNTGWAISRMKYDEKSQQLSAAYYNVDDKPMTGKDGYHRIQYKYDKSGNVIEYTFFGKDEKPALLNGFHKLLRQYDGKNRLTLEAIFSTNGKPTDGKRSYFKCVTSYAKDGTPASEKYYKANGSLLASRNYNRSTGQWGGFSMAGSTGGNMPVSAGETGNWRGIVQEYSKQCPANMGNGVVLQSLTTASNSVVVTIKLSNVSAEDTDISGKVEELSGMANQLKQGMKKELKLPSDVSVIISIVDKAGKSIVRL